MQKIGIHSVPRSGSSWLAQIFNSAPHVVVKFQPLFSYAFKNYLNENSTCEDISNFFAQISLSDDAFINQSQQRDIGIYPTFKKDKNLTHIIYKEVRYHHIIKNLLMKDKEIILFGLIRNPFAVINSWLNTPREFRKDLGWSEEQEWLFATAKNENKIEEFFGFNKWMEVALMFEELAAIYPERFYITQYSNLLADTHTEIKKMFNFARIPMEQTTVDFIQASRNKNDNNKYSVYKQRAMDENWKNELSPTIILGIEKILATKTQLLKYL
ncbi:MAG TPA: sulfotransferase domain-containing protein [Bacteroidia bacterium]|nr:sulfotransferase domain-containing protein [Bacteroidia bacterium]